MELKQFNDRDLHPEVTVSSVKRLFDYMRARLKYMTDDVPLLQYVLWKCAEAAEEERQNRFAMLMSGASDKGYKPDERQFVHMHKRGRTTNNCYRVQACDCGYQFISDNFHYCPLCGAKIIWKHPK